jgi:hypothetical protein
MTNLERPPVDGRSIFGYHKAGPIQFSNSLRSGGYGVLACWLQVPALCTCTYYSPQVTIYSTPHSSLFDVGVSARRPIIPVSKYSVLKYVFLVLT